MEQEEEREDDLEGSASSKDWLKKQQMPDPLTYIDEAFGEGGWLSQAFPTYKPRDGQVQLASRIAKALFDGVPIIAEGPTGTGKSFAYAIPAAYHAVAMRKRVLIVTANIALQEQLVKKDLPTLKDILPWYFSFELFKGRSNYLCIRRGDQTDIDFKLGKYRMLEQEEQDEIRRLAEWAKTTKTGDVSDVVPATTGRVWSRFAVNSEDCIGRVCPNRRDCHSQRHRDQIVRSHIIVTNYHMLFAGIQSHRLLPEYDAVILDEAHKMVDIGREFFGFKVSDFAIKMAANRLPQEYRSAYGRQDIPLRQRIELRSREFFDAAKSYVKGPDYKVRLRVQPPLPYESLIEELLEGADVAKEIAGSDAEVTDRAEAEITQKRFSTLAKNLQMAMDPEASHEHVFYFEEDRAKDKVTLCAQKFNISFDLEEEFFRFHPAVLVSATLSVNGEFTHLIDETGLSPLTRTFEAETPFSWKDQAFLIVPERFPDPTDGSFRATVSEAMVEIVKMARGRTLCLFTSWDGLKHAHKRMLEEKLPYRILAQGDSPRTVLVAEFLKDTSSVLLGVESFWQGIDVPGESLSCVVIDKLPFPHKNDPVLDALDELERGKGNSGAFMSYSIPRAIIAFKQGFGRLIRTTTDFGVVVLLDRRIHTKREVYGRQFLNSLPNIPRSTNLDDVERLLGAP